MDEKQRASGITTIASDVIETIITQTAVETKGVSRMSPHRTHSGVKLKIDEKTVNTDVYVILKAKENTNKVGLDLQKNIARAISETVGMETGRINIHVDNFDFVSPEGEIKD